MESSHITRSERLRKCEACKEGARALLERAREETPPKALVTRWQAQLLIALSQEMKAQALVIAEIEE